MRNESAGSWDDSETSLLTKAPGSRSLVSPLGRKVVRFCVALHGLGAFALITLGVMLTKFSMAGQVIRPVVFSQLVRSGLRLLPMVIFLGMALGLVVIGQTVSLLNRVGAGELAGTVMVIVVVRELGPLITALLVLTRTGTANVIELGTSRATGEVEALEVLGVDPIHYFVVPRVVGLAFGVFSLTIYLILVALVSGYLWAFLQDVPLLPGDYFRQLAGALRGLDFVVLALKTCLFGAVIAIVTCYYGLAQPLRLEEVSRATVSAVAHSMVVCVLLDAVFIVIYLVA